MFKIFHKFNYSTFEKKYKDRLDSETIKSLGFHIKPIDQSDIFDLYYIPTNNMINQITKIYTVSNQLNRTYEKLPGVARNQFLYESIAEELYHTNQLEGVKSSRAEIIDSMKHIQLNTKDKTRFNSMIQMYQSLMTENISIPESPKDIRKIYDKITDGEIKGENKLDGELFRKDVVHVLSHTGTGKVVHRGILPESKIIKEIGQLLTFMNTENSIPSLIKIAIGHYYFGYIHPFYDGNGRTSRFISGLYLQEVLGKISALSISRGANKNIRKYSLAFDRTNSAINRGEMNYFIETFLEILYQALQEMNNELKEKQYLLKSFHHKLEKESKNITEQEKRVLFILAQHYYFDYSEGVTVKELARIIELSEITIRKTLKGLLEREYIKKIGIRPAYYSLHERYLETE